MDEFGHEWEAEASVRGSNTLVRFDCARCGARYDGWADARDRYLTGRVMGINWTAEGHATAVFRSTMCDEVVLMTVLHG